MYRLTIANVKRELKIPVPVAALLTSYFSKSSISGISEMVEVESGLDGGFLCDFDFFADLVLTDGESGKAG